MNSPFESTAAHRPDPDLLAAFNAGTRRAADAEPSRTRRVWAPSLLVGEVAPNPAPRPPAHTFTGQPAGRCLICQEYRAAHRVVLVVVPTVAGGSAPGIVDAPHASAAPGLDVAPPVSGRGHSPP